MTENSVRVIEYTRDRSVDLQEAIEFIVREVSNPRNYYTEDFSLATDLFLVIKEHANRDAILKDLVQSALDYKNEFWKGTTE